MEVKQIAAFVNEAAKQATGVEGLVAEDLSNIVEAGDTLANTVGGVENFMKVLPDVIGKTVIANKSYAGEGTLGLAVDGWEYGSILQKIRVNMPVENDNQTWELVNGQSYDENIFTAPEAEHTYYDSKTTFEISMSFADRQVKSAFKSAASMNAFISGIYTQIANRLKIDIENLSMRLICNQIAETVYSEVTSGAITGRSGVKAVNLLYLYNTRFSTSLTAANAMTEPAFLKFAAYIMGLYQKRLQKASTLFNMKGFCNFTTPDRLKTILLADFAKAIGPYSLASAYNEEYLTLPAAQTVAYWQGSGTGFSFDDVSKVHVSETAQGHAKTVTGVIGVMFDKEACVVANQDSRITAKYNARAEFTNEWHKQDCSYLVDDYEPFVVFYLATA